MQAKRFVSIKPITTMSHRKNDGLKETKKQTKVENGVLVH